MKIPAREWNKLLAWLVRNAHPLAGENCRISRRSSGTMIMPDARAFRFRHPWQVTPAWNAETKSWWATVRPGFVNGTDPTIDGVPITATPAPWLGLPFDEISGAPPKFFADLGVRDPDEGFRTGGSTGVQIVDESWRDDFRPAARRLAKCDVSLSVARAALDGAPTAQDAGATGQNIDWTPSINTGLLDSRGARPVLQASAAFSPPKTPSLMDRLMGTASDPQEDAILIATVYLLSPANFDGPINGSWTPYIKGACFWNLAHAPRVAKLGDATPIRLATGLAGGMFDGFFNQLLAPGNDAADRIAGAMASQSSEGRFWTV